MKNIVKHIIFLALVLLPIVTLDAQSHRQPKAPTDSIVFRGWGLHVDVVSPLMCMAVDKGVIGGEAQFDINLLNKFFPIVEFGWWYANSESAVGSVYKSNSPFWRIGLNYNFLKTKTENGVEKLNKNYPFVGLRYGMSVVNHELYDVPYSNKYWNETNLVDINGKNSYAGWLEIIGGVRIDVVKGLTMGWSVRAKMLLHSSIKSKQEIWCVPGYGRSSSAQFSFNYTIGFTYRTKFERSRISNF